MLDLCSSFKPRAWKGPQQHQNCDQSAILIMNHEENIEKSKHEDSDTIKIFTSAIQENKCK